MLKVSTPEHQENRIPENVFRRTVSDRPTNILLAATCRWPLAARLAMRFGQAGCRVEVVCPRGHLASKTRAVARTYIYHPLVPLTSFRRAIQATEHDLVMPCDDLAAAHMYDLWEADISSEGPLRPIAALSERSFGAPGSLASVTRRSSLMEIARSEGITVPKTAAVRTLDELEAWIDKAGFPVVLKADGTAAGIGVRIARTRLEAARAFRELGSPPASMRVLKRGAIDRDLTLVLPFALRKRALVNAQIFVSGRDATASLACWQGKLVASFTFEVLRAPKPNGPASVVRVLDNPQISEASARLVRRLNLSGLYGLDFKIDDRNVAYLLEMNPRATQSSHLSFGKDRDLVGGLLAAMSGQKFVESEPAITSSVVALFPNEWQDNPASELLRVAYHDVPWSEPELVRACMKRPSRLESWCSSEGRAELQAKIGWPGTPGSGSSGQFDGRKIAPRTESPEVIAGSNVPPFASGVESGEQLQKCGAR